MPDDRCLVSWLVPGDWLTSDWCMVIKCPVPGEWWLVLGAWWSLLNDWWPVTGTWNRWLVTGWLVPGWPVINCLMSVWPVIGWPVTGWSVIGWPVTGWPVTGWPVSGWRVTCDRWLVDYTLDALSTHVPLWWVLPQQYSPVGWCSHQRSCLQMHLIRKPASSCFFSSFSWLTFLQNKCVSYLQESRSFLTKDYRWNKLTTWNKKNMINNFGDYPTALLYVHNRRERPSWKVMKMYDMDKRSIITRNRKMIYRKW